MTVSTGKLRPTPQHFVRMKMSHKEGFPSREMTSGHAHIILKRTVSREIELEEPGRFTRSAKAEDKQVIDFLL